MKTEQVKQTRLRSSDRFKPGSGARKSRFLAVLLISLFALSACVDDLNPSGGWSGITPDGDYLYVGSKDGRVVRIDSSSGALDRNWTYPAIEDDDLGEIYGTPQVRDGVVYGSAFRCRGNECDGEVFAVDIETGRSAWTAGTVEYETRLVGDVGVGESTIAVGTSAISGNETPRGFLIGLDATPDIGLELAEQVGNREKWRLPLDGAVWGGVSVADDVAYFGTMQGTLYAVDLSDRSEYDRDTTARVLWSFDADGAIVGTPLVNESNVYFGSFNDRVYSLDISHRLQNPTSSTLNSSSEWAVDLGGWVWSQPLLNDGTLYAANLQGEVFALNATNGQKVWRESAVTGNEVVAQPVIFESNRGPALAVASGEKDISVLLLATGEVTGIFDTDNRGMKSSPIVVGDVIFVHTDSGQLRQYRTDSLSLLNCIEAKGEGKAC